MAAETIHLAGLTWKPYRGGWVADFTPKVPADSGLRVEPSLHVNSENPWSDSPGQVAAITPGQQAAIEYFLDNQQQIFAEVLDQLLIYAQGRYQQDPDWMEVLDGVETTGDIADLLGEFQVRIERQVIDGTA